MIWACSPSSGPSPSGPQIARIPDVLRRSACLPIFHCFLHALSAPRIWAGVFCRLGPRADGKSISDLLANGMLPVLLPRRKNPVLGTQHRSKIFRPVCASNVGEPAQREDLLRILPVQPARLFPSHRRYPRWESIALDLSLRCAVLVKAFLQEDSVDNRNWPYR